MVFIIIGSLLVLLIFMCFNVESAESSDNLSIITFTFVPVAGTKR